MAFWSKGIWHWCHNMILWSRKNWSTLRVVLLMITSFSFNVRYFQVIWTNVMFKNLIQNNIFSSLLKFCLQVEAIGVQQGKSEFVKSSWCGNTKMERCWNIYLRPYATLQLCNLLLQTRNKSQEQVSHFTYVTGINMLIWPIKQVNPNLFIPSKSYHMARWGYWHLLNIIKLFYDYTCI